jgi:hypothetical protein
MVRKLFGVLKFNAFFGRDMRRFFWADAHPGQTPADALDFAVISQNIWSSWNSSPKKHCR